MLGSIKVVIERDRTMSGSTKVMIERDRTMAGPIRVMLERDRTLSDPNMVPIDPRTPMVRRDVTRSRSHRTMASPSVTRIDPIVAMLPPLSSRMGEPRASARSAEQQSEGGARAPHSDRQRESSPTSMQS